MLFLVIIESNTIWCWWIKGASLCSMVLSLCVICFSLSSQCPLMNKTLILVKLLIFYSEYFFSYICVYGICAWAYVCSQMCICVHMCGKAQVVMSVFFDCLKLIQWHRISPVNLQLVDTASSATWFAVLIPFLHLLSSEITVGLPHSPAFKWVLGILTLVFILARQ